MLFNRLIRALWPQMNTHPININHDGIHYEALEAHQRKYDKGNDTQKDLIVFIVGATVAVQQEDGKQ